MDIHEWAIFANQIIQDPKQPEKIKELAIDILTQYKLQLDDFLNTPQGAKLKKYIENIHNDR